MVGQGQVKEEKKAEPWASEIALWIRVLLCEPSGLSSILELSVKGEYLTPKSCPLTSLGVSTLTHVTAPRHTHTQTQYLNFTSKIFINIYGLLYSKF